MHETKLLRVKHKMTKEINESVIQIATIVIGFVIFLVRSVLRVFDL